MVKPAQLQSLQMLRAVAALSVVYFHLQHVPHVGEFGVDIFFVLSGFLMAMLVEARVSPGYFLLQRITRIVPLYWIMTASVFFVAWVHPALLNSTTADASHLLKSLLFIPYFKENGALHPMLAVGWTLNYEMFFYATLAGALWLRPTHIGATTVAMIGAAFMAGARLPSAMAFGAFLQQPLVFEFVLGMAVYRFKHAALLKKTPLWVAGLLVVAAYGWMVGASLKGVDHRLLHFGVPAAVMVVFAIQLEPWLVRADTLLTRAWVHVGDASYAIYLSHFYVVEGMRKLIAPHVSFLTPERGFGAWITMLLALVVGVFLYRYVDRPAMHYARALLAHMGFGKRSISAEH
jgi:exopolysaccharide production protein ExoZ